MIDIGLGGMRFVAHGLVAGQHETSELHLPGAEPCEVSYEVVHVGTDGVVGALFERLPAKDRRALARFVGHHSSLALLERLQQELDSDEIHNLKPLGDPIKTRGALGRLAEGHSRLQLFTRPDGRSMPAQLSGATDDRIVLELTDRAETPPPFSGVLVKLESEGTLLLGDTQVVEVDEQADPPRIELITPERLYLPERRIDLRDEAEPAGVGCAVVDWDGGEWEWTVLEVSDSGLSLRVPATEAEGLDRGVEVLVTLSDGFDSQSGAFPARVVRRVQLGGAGAIRVGLERLVVRGELEARRLKVDSAKGSLGRTLTGLVRTGLRSIGFVRSKAVDVFEYENRRGERIVALRNTAGTPRGAGPVPTVVIPPAYGKRKEDTAGLAHVLVGAFAAVGEPLVVVRYDGTGSVGESHRSGRFGSDPDYDNAEFLLSRAVEDLEDTLTHLESQDDFILGPVCVISFSLAAVVARRVVARDAGRRIRSWIAPLGAADARDVVRNSTGGRDYLGEYRLGDRAGLRPVVGHMIDTNAFCDDAWLHGLADLAQARHDMAEVGVPITWLCGDYDCWVNVLRVKDVLSVGATEGRDLLRIPTGHVLRDRRSALDVFRFLAGRVGRDLLGRTLQPGQIDLLSLRDAVRAERERVHRPPVGPAYWKRYLSGDPDNPLGFDVLTLTAEYSDLVGAQVELLGVEPGDRVVDLGSGTGNCVETIVEALPLVEAPRTQFDLVDVVPDALARGREKLKRLPERRRCAPTEAFVHVLDLAELADGGRLPFGDASVSHLLASLLLSYVPDPLAVLKEARRVLEPGGRIVVSSMYPDTDLSKPLYNLLARVEAESGERFEGHDRKAVLDAIHSYVNDAARLLDHAALGAFEFYEGPELRRLVRRAGFTGVQESSAFGNPAQAVIVVGRRPGLVKRG